MFFIALMSTVVAPEASLFKFLPEIGIVFKTSHYAGRLEKAGLDVKIVEGLVRRDVTSFAHFVPPGSGFGGTLNIGASAIRYSGQLLPSEIISIGTIYKVIPK